LPTKVHVKRLKFSSERIFRRSEAKEKPVPSLGTEWGKLPSIYDLDDRLPLIEKRHGGPQMFRQDLFQSILGGISTSQPYDLGRTTLAMNQVDKIPVFGE
jgi:hypothetical protein